VRGPILLAAPRGFCAGVDRAIEIVELALDAHGPPIFVRHEIVHNRHVVDRLRARGAVFTDDLATVPSGSLLILSAHGVSPAVREEALRRGLRVLDATCPLVTKVHVEALRRAREGYEIVLIGHRGHVEVEGTLGHAPGRMHLVASTAEVADLRVRDPERLAVLTQTTLSVDDTRETLEALRARFPRVRVPAKDDICYATQNRQNAVKAIARRADAVVVVGAGSSSNSNRLVEVARAQGTRAVLAESAEALAESFLEGVRTIGLTAGASTPDSLVQGMIARLARAGFGPVEEVRTAQERIEFTLPPGLRREASTGRPSA
jgi:4-hydroxy-3-methylbut-2-enyl diphosphate reductase